MKIGMNLAAFAFTCVLSLAGAAGCSTSTEPTTDDDTTGQEQTDTTSSETPPPVEEGTLTPSATCPPVGTCALALSKCPNPRIGGSYCYVAQQCALCRH